MINEARREYQKKYRAEHREQLRIKRREWRERNKNDINLCYREYYTRNREEIRKERRKNYTENKDEYHKKFKKYRDAHPEIIKAAAKRYGVRNNHRPEVRYKNAKLSAKRRSISFDLTCEQYVKLIGPECFYCNGFFGRVTTGVGLDRMDNSKGYTIDNCVSCCKSCNGIKNSILTVEETKAAVKAIIRVRKKHMKTNHAA